MKSFPFPVRARWWATAGLFCGLAAVAGSVAATQSATVPPVPRRIVSLNLCTDQLVLALADRSQIKGLTRNAVDPLMSAEASAAKGLPLLHGSAEELLAARPDLVIGLPGGANAITDIATAQGYRTVDVPWASSYRDIVASIRIVARAVGHSDRGERLIARMNRDLAHLPKAPAGTVAAYYQRRGYLTGAGTLVDDLMRRAGLLNLAVRIGRPALSQVSLEEMVAAQPDFLIVETAGEQSVDQGTEMLHHPALKAIPRIGVAESWTVCGGPAYVKAARRIAQAVSRRARPARP